MGTKAKNKGKMMFAQLTKGGSTTPTAPFNHLAALEPIPDSASSDPLGWADKHLETLIPRAAKEKEWQLKFGNDSQRDKVASELLAMRGMGPKRDTNVQVAAVIQMIPFANPWAKPVEQVDDRDAQRLLQPTDATTKATKTATRPEPVEVDDEEVNS